PRRGAGPGIGEQGAPGRARARRPEAVRGQAGGITQPARPHARPGFVQTRGVPTKVILDVDTGTDDAVALMTAALSPDLELVGATTVNGNTTIDYTTENTLRVFDWIGMPQVPVHRGVDRPLVRTDVKR